MFTPFEADLLIDASSPIFLLPLLHKGFRDPMDDDFAIPAQMRYRWISAQCLALGPSDIALALDLGLALIFECFFSG